MRSLWLSGWARSSPILTRSEIGRVLSTGQWRRGVAEGDVARGLLADRGERFGEAMALKREIILLGCAILFLGAGVFLFWLEGGGGASTSASDEDAAAKSRGVQASERAGRETMMGFFRVVEDEATGEFAVYFPPGREIAHFSPPVELEIAGLWGLASGAFFAHQPAANGMPARCQLIQVRMEEGMGVRRFAWDGRCRLPKVLVGEFFWLDYVPFGARSAVSLPLRMDEGGAARLVVSWQEEGAREVFEAQFDALGGEVAAQCGEGLESQACHAALRSLVFLGCSDGEAAVARVSRGLSEEGQGFVAAHAAEICQELEDLLVP